MVRLEQIIVLSFGSPIKWKFIYIYSLKATKLDDKQENCESYSSFVMCIQNTLADFSEKTVWLFSFYILFVNFSFYAQTKLRDLFYF